MPLEMKYFVLKPGGSTLFARASRIAMFEFAHIIKAEDQELAQSLFDWVRREDQADDKTSSLTKQRGRVPSTPEGSTDVQH